MKPVRWVENVPIYQCRHCGGDSVHKQGNTKYECSTCGASHAKLSLIAVPPTMWGPKRIKKISVPPMTDTTQIIAGLRDLVRYCGDDPERPGVVDSPARFLKAMKEMTSGYASDPALFLRKEFKLDDHEVTSVSAYGELIISGPLPFVSLCEHHFLAFQGEAWIGYIPDVKKGRVVGLSKLARMLDGYANRFQVQERLTQQIGDATERELKPKGIGVVLKAQHSCQCFRGVKKPGSMITSAVYGVLRTKPSAKAEFMRLISL